MKLTSPFLAIVGLAVCQLAAASPAPENSVPDTIYLQYWLQPNFQGLSGVSLPYPGSCTALIDPFRNSIQSISVGPGASCYFYTGNDCSGGQELYQGSTPMLRPPMNANTLSHICNYNTGKSV